MTSRPDETNCTDACDPRRFYVDQGSFTAAQVTVLRAKVIELMIIVEWSLGGAIILIYLLSIELMESLFLAVPVVAVILSWMTRMVIDRFLVRPGVLELRTALENALSIPFSLNAIKTLCRHGGAFQGGLHLRLSKNDDRLSVCAQESELAPLLALRWLPFGTPGH